MTDFDLATYENTQPNINIDGVIYFIPNQSCLWRANTLHDKEPDTLNWIANFDRNDILIDIGANVGMYSLRAAVKHGLKVYAFEPESQNYAVLCKNIMINDAADKILAYCMAVSDESCSSSNIYFDKLNLSSLTAGDSCHSFGNDIDFNLKPKKSLFRQGCMSISLDHFMEVSEIRHTDQNIHIKIDVDGIEHKVVASALHTIQLDRVQSLLIELNTNLGEHNKIIDLMEGLGFKMTIHPNAIRKEGPFQGIGNHIFIRK